MEGAPVAQRRRWSDAFKAEMVARCLEPGTNVSALAREIGISPSQLFGWRTCQRAPKFPQKWAFKNPWFAAVRGTGHQP
ncbi:transposase [Pelagibacterium sediminicola]|uniref:transposase n=1 Tax=Pelagibacterium sediminicola TaxID=2248761 RepID=UPI002482C8CB|nr:transposase [Pelagibacterium sediminicola]